MNSGEEVGETVHPKIMRSSHAPVDGAWLEEELAALERLVDEGDTLELVAKLRAMVDAPKRAAVGTPIAHISGGALADPVDDLGEEE